MTELVDDLLFLARSDAQATERCPKSRWIWASLVDEA